MIPTFVDYPHLALIKDMIRRPRDDSNSICDLFKRARPLKKLQFRYLSSLQIFYLDIFRRLKVLTKTTHFNPFASSLDGAFSTAVGVERKAYVKSRNSYRVNRKIFNFLRDYAISSVSSIDGGRMFIDQLDCLID